MIRAGLVIPFFNHARGIAATLEAVARYGLPCWIVDDGSDAAQREELLTATSKLQWVRVERHEKNEGKGAAVATGMRAALSGGCTHAVQIDADNQLDAGTIDKMLALAAMHPTAVIAGSAVYSADVPRARLYGRYVTHFWVWVHTLSLEISDSMCGLRLYPIADMLRVWDREHVGRRMDFDTDILVRLYWDGAPVIQVPTRVSYPPDGVSHFRMGRDNLRITWMHTRLFFGMLRRVPRLITRRAKRQ